MIRLSDLLNPKRSIYVTNHSFAKVKLNWQIYWTKVVSLVWGSSLVVAIYYQGRQATRTKSQVRERLAAITRHSSCNLSYSSAIIRPDSTIRAAGSYPRRYALDLFDPCPPWPSTSRTFCCIVLRLRFPVGHQQHLDSSSCVGNLCPFFPLPQHLGLRIRWS